MTDTEQQDRSLLWKQYNREDRFLRWFYQPHTLTMLMGVGALILYYAFTRTDTSFVSNTRVGAWAAAFAFLVFAALQMPDGLFVRPHPVLWRTVTGVGVLYLCFCVFLLFQTADDARQLLKWFDPSLGVKLPERSYAENCSSWQSVKDAVFDEFILAHLFGWFGKAFLFRDVYLCWLMSILFEIVELTFQHMLPNFAECWWDHIIIDILVCNWLGFTVGLWLIHKFSVKPYRWIQPEFEEYHWGILSDWKRLIAVVGLIIAINLVELNAFFLKFVLWVPPRNMLNTYRLYIWWSIGLPGVKEFYTWVTDKNCKKFGPSSWLCTAIMGVELAICFKFGVGMFPAEHPPVVVYSWSLVAVSFVAWAVWWYGFRLPETKKQRLDKKSASQESITGASGNGSAGKAAAPTSPRSRKKAKAT